MKKTTKISSVLLLISISTIFIKIPPVYQFIRIPDIFLILSIVFLIISIIKKDINLKINKRILFIPLVWILINIIATFISFVLYKELPLKIITLNYLKLLSSLFIFIIIILIHQKDKLILKKSLFALLLSLIIVPITIILQATGHINYVMFNPIRFSGLLIDPNYFANFQIIPTIIVLFFSIKNKNKILSIISYIAFIFSMTTILWSGSRSGIIGIFLSIVLLILFFIRFSKKTWKEISVTVLFIIIALPISFMFVPKYEQTAKKIIENKQIYTEITKNTLDNNIKEKTGVENEKIITTNDDIIEPDKLEYKKEKEKTRVLTFSNISTLLSSNDRLSIWKSSICSITRNPFGYGPGYDQIAKISGKGGGLNHVAHNLELEILLQGGILLFILFNYLIIKLLIETYKTKKFKEFNESHLLISILLGLLASGLFLDIILQKWIWLIISLLIIYIIENKK